MALLLLASWGAAVAGADDHDVRRHRPVAFEANRGQVDEQVKFLARGAGYTALPDVDRRGVDAGAMAIPSGPSSDCRLIGAQRRARRSSPTVSCPAS